MDIGDLFWAFRGDGGKQLELDAVKSGEAAGLKGSASFQASFGKHAKAVAATTGAVLGTMFGGAIESGAKFEDQLRTINTVARVSDAELGGIGDSIQALSRETGKTTDDLTSGFYDLVSAGVPAGEAINVLRDSAKFATGALGTTSEAVDLVTSALNAYGLQASDSGRVTDIFAKAVADGKVTAAELGATIANIAPIAASAGISLEEVSAGYALLTAKGVPAAQAATQMRAAISALLTPNVQLNAIQKETGINFAELAKAKGLAVALDALRKATGGNADAFAKSLGSIEAYQFALATTGENAERMADQIVSTTNAAGIAQEQYNEKSKSGVEQGKRLQAVLATLVQDFGGAAQAAAPFLMTLNAMFPALKGLISPAKLLGGALGGLAGALASGPLQGALAKAGDLGATIYLKALFAGDRFGAAIDALRANPKVSAATGKLGDFMGSKLGKGLSIAFAAVAIFEVIETYNKIKAGLAEQTGQISDNIASQIQAGTQEQLQQSKAALQTGLAELDKVWDLGLFTGDTRKRLQSDLAAVESELSRRAIGLKPAGAQAGKAYADGFTSETSKISSDLSAALADIADNDEVTGQAKLAGAALMLSYGQGIHEARQKPLDAFETLVEMLKHQLTPAKEAARLAGQLTSKELAAGMKSKDPEVRAQANAVSELAIDRLRQMVREGGPLAKEAMDKLNAGLRSKNPEIRAQAQAAKNAVIDELNTMKAPAATAGENAGLAAATGLMSTKVKMELLNAGGWMTRLVSGTFNATFAKLVASGEISYRPGSRTGFAAGGRPPVRMASWVGERGPELFVPDRPGTILPAEVSQRVVAAAAAPPSPINVTIHNPEPHAADEDIGRMLRRLSHLGMVGGV